MSPNKLGKALAGDESSGDTGKIIDLLGRFQHDEDGSGNLARLECLVESVGELEQELRHLADDLGDTHPIVVRMAEHLNVLSHALLEAFKVRR